MFKAKELFMADKKLSVVVLILIVSLLTIGLFTYINKSYAATDGTYGTCRWEIDDNGKLTLSPQAGDTSCTLGTVSSANRIPWYSNKDDVLSVEVSQGVEANVNSRYLFSGLTNATSIDASNLDTSNVTSMYDMFNGCWALTSLNVSNFDTRNVETMGGMFQNCVALTSLDLSNFTTGNVVEMRSMFYNCRALTSLNVTSFDTSNVNTMMSMFQGCEALTSLDVTRFNTSNVTNMNQMFAGCKSLTSLDVTNFVTSKVINMLKMFYNCQSLINLDVTHFNTSNVTVMQEMFTNCYVLTPLDVTSFDTSKVTNMISMFSSCNALTSLDVTGFDTGNVTNMSGMFSGCRALTSLDVTGFDTSKVSNISSMFSGCMALTSLDVTHFNTSNVTNMQGMFNDCGSLASLDVAHFNTSNVTNMAIMFKGCSSLTKLDVSNFNTSNVTAMQEMFSGDSLLTNLDVTHFDTSHVTSVNKMFNNCNSLTELDLSSFDMNAIEGSASVIDMLYRIGINNNGGCKITLNKSFNKTYSAGSYYLPWSYYAKEIGGELQGLYTLTEMQTETTGSDTPTIWVPAYKVTYNGNGGTISGNNTLVKSYRIGSKIPTRGITPVKSNSHFTKFTNTQDGEGTLIEINRNADSTYAYGNKYATLPSPLFSNGNINLYAQYKEDQDITMSVSRRINGVPSSVTNTFGYTITPDSNNPGTATGIPQSFTIAFNNDVPSSGYAQKGTNIDFNNATYTDPGDYKFTIRETSSTNTTTYPLSSDVWEVYVNIRNVMDYEDVPTGEYERSVIMKKVGETNKDNNMLFVGNAALTNITINKEVRGNLAKTEEYFEVKVNVGGTGSYKITGLDSEVTYKGSTVHNPTTMLAGADEYIYIKDSQTATIGLNGNVNQIPSGTTYRIVEENSDDYSTTINGTSGKDSGNKTTSLSGNSISIINTKEELVPTGVILKIVPYVIFVLVIISGFIFFVISKKRINTN